MFVSYFDQLNADYSAIAAHNPKKGYEKFAVSEFLRLRSIGGTLLANFKDNASSVDERNITHILMRSLLENYFWLLFIFDTPDEATRQSKFDSYMNGFKIEYAKLYDEPMLTVKGQIEPPDASWKKLQKPLNVNDMLTSMKNDYGDRLNYLYFVYRIFSFDTHGKVHTSFFEEAFGKQCNFPIIKISKVLDLMANQYLIIWQDIR